MKKSPSYPKITSKTNITFLQTQNININSPKSFALTSNDINKKILFKSSKPDAHKTRPYKQKSQNSVLKTHQIEQDPKSSKVISQKNKNHSTTEKRQYRSTKNLLRYDSNKSITKLSVSDASNNKPQQKSDIKKLQQKLKLLQQKIQTLKTTKSSKDLSSSNRSKSRKTDILHAPSQSTIKFPKEKFQKPLRPDIPSMKFLKKTTSDKNLLHKKPPKIPVSKIHSKSKPFSTNSISSVSLGKQQQKQKHEQQVIHKFVTQVEKTSKMVNHHPHMDNNKKICYYLSYLSESIKNTDYMIYKEHLVQSLQTIAYLQNILRPSLKDLEKHSVNLMPHKKSKYTLVLDLDETLIHCNETTDTPHDVCLKIKFPTGEKIDAGINIRPHAQKLLKQLSEICEIIVFTASHECYANVVLDHLDPHHKYISHRLYRHHCWLTQEGVYIKDLRILKNRDLQNVLLVDNAAYSYFYQLQNGIPIIPFYDDKEDDELLLLIGYIKTIIGVKQTHNINNTLKKVNHQYFKLTDYTQFKDIQNLTKKLYVDVLKEYENIHA